MPADRTKQRATPLAEQIGGPVVVEVASFAGLLAAARRLEELPDGHLTAGVVMIQDLDPGQVGAHRQVSGADPNGRAITSPLPLWSVLLLGSSTRSPSSAW